jgi:hypothetical protein
MRTHILKRSLAAVLASLVIMATPALSRAAMKNFMTVINGAQETPPSGTVALGNGILTYDTATDTLCFYIVHDGTVVGGEIAAHIHGPAAPGVGPAPVVVALPLGNSKTGCVVAPPPPFNKTELFKNLYYVNIHSNFLPAGEIRGQIYRIK